MLKANIIAKIQQLNNELESIRKDKQRISNLINSLQSKERITDMQSKDLEYKIMQLEEELTEDE